MISTHSRSTLEYLETIGTRTLRIDIKNKQFNKLNDSNNYNSSVDNDDIE